MNLRRLYAQNTPIDSLPIEGRLTLCVVLAGTVAAVIAWITVELLPNSAFTTKPNLSVQQGNSEVTLFWSAFSKGDESCWEIKKNSEIMPIRKIEEADVGRSAHPPDGTAQEYATSTPNRMKGAAQDRARLKEWSHTVANLTNGRTYDFSVRAKYECRQYGPWSNVVHTGPIEEMAAREQPNVNASSTTTHLLSRVENHFTEISQKLVVSEDAAKSAALLAQHLPAIASSTAAIVGQIERIAAREQPNGNASSTTTHLLSRVENHFTEISQKLVVSEDAAKSAALLAQHLPAIASRTATIVGQIEKMAGRHHARKSINVTFGRVGDKNETTVVYPISREDAADTGDVKVNFDERN